MSRVVKGLKWAKRLEGRPARIPREVKRSGARLAGLRYEGALAKKMPPEWKHGVWWEFEDEEGPGYCQTDFVGISPKWVIVLECKYTWTEEAERQLWELYLPVVGKAMRKSVVPVVVCKRLVAKLNRPIFASLERAVEESYLWSSRLVGTAVWHYLGGVPLLRGLNGEGQKGLDKMGQSPIIRP